MQFVIKLLLGKNCSVLKYVPQSSKQLPKPSSIMNSVLKYVPEQQAVARAGWQLPVSRHHPPVQIAMRKESIPFLSGHPSAAFGN